jgi:hypothetical protein
MAETREHATPEERADRQRRLIEVGTLVFGASWKASMAREIKAVTGREPPVKTVDAWASGAKPVPAWASEAVRRVAEKAVVELRERAHRLKKLTGPRRELTPEQEARADAECRALVDSRTEEEVFQEAIEDAGRRHVEYITDSAP